MKRFLLFAIMCVCVSVGAWAIDIQGGGGTYEVAANGVATFNVTKAGAIAGHWDKQIIKNLPDKTRIVFTPGSKINEADLTTILTSGTDQKKFYIDLFDIVGDGGPTLTEIDSWIQNGVSEMANNYGYQYGLILPYNSSLGTMAVEMSNGNQYNNVATFTHYVAYYRDTNDTNNLVLHVFDSFYHQQNTSTYTYSGADTKTYYANAVAHLNTHSQVANAHTALVSTITNIQFDLGQLSASKVKIEITHNDIIGGHTNPAIPEKANIYATSMAPGGFAEHISTAGTKDTPTDILQISGSVTMGDVLSANSFGNGPRVLNLRNATVQGAGVTSSLLSSLENTNIEYILLPAGVTKDVINGANYADLTSLKAVISAGSTDLVAYVKEAGSLAEARVLATGGTTSTETAGGETYTKFVPTTQYTLKNVTLTGNLNASDLASGVNQNSAVSIVDGHLYSDASFDVSGMPSTAATANGYTTKTGITEGSSALNGETITSLDLSGAVFENNYDMNFNLLGLTSLASIKLPTNSDMKVIPMGCFYGNKAMTYICIPCNYETIGRYAFADNLVNCITTDNAAHTLVVGKAGEVFVDDAPAKEALGHTFTFSPNVKSIGLGAFAVNDETITDVYVLATTTPLCEKDAFSSGMTKGWGGFTGGDYPYCREKYNNNGKIFTMLHYPAGDVTSDSYIDMEKLYTDIYKIYTKKEQTGAVDGNGRAITWPTQAEIYRVFNQASVSDTWHDWDTAYDTNHEVNDSESYGSGYTKDNTQTVGTPDYDFAGYEGWHQFVLARATVVDPTDVTKQDNKIVREYEDAGWFTFCIPYDMTIGQVIETMGIPASDDQHINKYKGNDVGSSPLVPDIRQLRSVERRPAAGGEPNKVIFRLTTNLFNSGEPMYLEFNHSLDAGRVIKPTSTVPASGTWPADYYDRRLLMGGRPYIIKAYKLKGTTIKSHNMGQYVMTHFGDGFKQSASCIYEGHYEVLGDDPDMITLKFAKPFEDHKIQAASDVQDETASGWLKYDDNGTLRKYHYTLVGQFWEQKLPLYSVYMSQGKWYRKSKENDYKWSRFKCVIMSTPTVDDGHPNGGGYRDNENSLYPDPVEYGNQKDLLENDLKIAFLDGRDDDDFDKAPQGKYMFMFDDDIIEYDNEDEEATSINSMDGEDLTSIPADAKVYNLSGQFVGTSLNGLSKGLYVVNGKKYVVK